MKEMTRTNSARSDGYARREQVCAPQEIQNVPFEAPPSIPPEVEEDLLVLFTESLGVCFAVGIEEFLAALLPRRFEFGRRDVPVRAAFLSDGT
jgi:hypothetical protein